MDDRQKAIIKHLEDLIKRIRQNNIEVLEMELVPHMESRLVEGVMMQSFLANIYTLRILYKET